MDIDSIREDYEHNRKDYSITQQEIDQLEAQKAEKHAEWETISSLGVGAICPRCQQTLSEKHYKLLESKIEKEIGEIDEKITGSKTKLIEIEEKTTSGKVNLTDLEKKAKRLNKLRVEEATLGKDREARDRYLADEEQARDRKSEHEALLENDSFANDQKQEIATINSQRTELKPHVQRYDELRNRGNQLEDMHVEDEYNESKAIVDRLPELTATQTTLESNKAGLRATLEEKTGDLSKIKAGLKKFEGLDAELSSLQEKDKALIRDEATEAARIKAQKTEVEATGQRITRLEEDLTRYKKDLLEAEELQIVETWLREILIPSLQMIEKNILLSLNQEFNKMFKRWFSELIESEELQGLIDEDFTPVVEQSGYGLDVESLSGGEKTSVALSYRLALNTIVKQATNTMKSNMLILDEPTDGFSKEQLFKMRDILNELDCSQVILVSHEKELETVADYIYRVRKDGNVSTVVPPV